MVEFRDQRISVGKALIMNSLVNTNKAIDLIYLLSFYFCSFYFCYHVKILMRMTPITQLLGNLNMTQA